MMGRIKSLLRKLSGGSREKASFDPDGVRYYDPASEMSFQGYFEENREEIFKGNVPKRYLEIAELVPGRDILEIGSADGTQALVLALRKNTVHGLELMPKQHEISLELKKAWLGLGRDVGNCHFHNGDACSHTELFSAADTVLMSRVVYHLRDGIDPLFRRIEDSGITNVVLVGCPLREKRWRESGETGDSMGRYAYFASLEGMRSLVEKHGFHVSLSIPSSEGGDPVVVASR